MNIDYSYLRPSKAKTMKVFHDKIKKKDHLLVQEVENGYILPLQRDESMLFGQGGCLDANREYVDESRVESRVYGLYPFENYDTVDSTVMYCGYIVRHWGHFIGEEIERLWYAIDNDHEIDYYVFFTEKDAEYELKGNYRELLSVLGILDKVLIINKPTKFRKIIVPERCFKRMELYSDDFGKLLDTIIQNVIQTDDCKMSYPSKVYLSRGRLYPKNNLIEYGMEAMDNYFANNGYKVLYPEQLSLQEMICYLYRADICASESGSTAHNFLFAPADSKIVIIERQVWTNEFQCDFDIIKNFDTTYVDAYYALYPVYIAGGPYLLYYTPQLDAFSKRMGGYTKPDEKFLSEKYKKQSIEWFITAYQKQYGYSLRVGDWVTEFSSDFVETFEDTNREFCYYLAKRSPIKTIIFNIIGNENYLTIRKKLIGI